MGLLRLLTSCTSSKTSVGVDYGVDLVSDTAAQNNPGSPRLLDLHKAENHRASSPSPLERGVSLISKQAIAIDINLTSGWLLRCRQHSNQCCFTGSIRSNQPVDFTGLYL